MSRLARCPRGHLVGTLGQVRASPGRGRAVLERKPAVTPRLTPRLTPRASTRPRRRGLVAAAVVGLLVPASAVAIAALPAEASSVSTAAFTGGAGTASVGGTLYAKNGAALT